MDLLTTRCIGVIFDTAVDVTSHESTCARVFELVELGGAAYVCFATAHMLVAASRQEEIKQAYRGASIVNPDGTPVAWCLKLMGYQDARCVNGPTHTPILLREAERRGVPVGFYGGRPETLAKMLAVLNVEYPSLKVAYVYSPPFRALSEEEQADDLAKINASGARLLFVGLGSPKQEIWMHRNYASMNCLCLGVGAVFEFLSGEKVLPPVWVQQLGLTWLVRLWQEPRRLARRNLYSPVFVVMFLMRFIPDVCRRVMGMPPRKQVDVWRDAQ
jgi:N-acetylglucosaminyldiphosphoundecaprenol N-acetyl-beta-D-mannosaminyltransferase